MQMWLQGGGLQAHLLGQISEVILQISTSPETTAAVPPASITALTQAPKQTCFLRMHELHVLQGPHAVRQQGQASSASCLEIQKMPCIVFMLKVGRLTNWDRVIEQRSNSLHSNKWQNYCS